jgi:GNAT superfamily N-acetyltransferase
VAVRARFAIRRADPGDAAVLTAIAHAAKRRWSYPETWIRLWRRDLTLTPRFISRHCVQCATFNGRIVGFYALSREGATFDLEHMWVDPGCMGEGVGARLFRHAVERVRGGGGNQLRIASDPNAEGFYRRMGARRIGEIASSPAGRTLPVLVVDVSGTSVELTPPDPAGTRGAGRATPRRRASTPRSSG